MKIKIIFLKLKFDSLETITLSVPKKLKNSIFEIPIIPQTLNINNQRTTSAKSVNLQIIRKLIEYSLKKVHVKAMFSFSVFEILLFQCRLLLSTALRGTRSERVKFSVQNQKKKKKKKKSLTSLRGFEWFLAQFF